MDAPFTALRTDIVSRWMIAQAGITIQDIADRLEYIGEPEFEWSTMPASAKPWFMILVPADGQATLVDGSHLVPGRGVWVNGADRRAGTLLPPVIRIEDRVIPQTILTAAIDGTVGDVLGHDLVPGLDEARIIAAETDPASHSTTLTLDPQWRTDAVEPR